MLAFLSVLVSCTGGDNLFVGLCYHKINRKRSCCSLTCLINEPRCEKTGLRGFQPGQAQTGLYSHRRWLDYLCSDLFSHMQKAGFLTTRLKYENVRRYLNSPLKNNEVV